LLNAFRLFLIFFFDFETGAAVVNTIEREKVIVLNNYNVAEFDLVMANDNFDNGKEELHEYLDDIDERREVIKALKRDVFVLNRKVEDHWNTDDMNLRNRYLLAVEGIHQNPLKGKIQKAESVVNGAQ
jgi:hypothetical protein